MKISYALQLKDFGIMLILGFLMGIIYGFINNFFTIKKFYLLQILSDILIIVINFTVFFIAVISINYGQIRLFLILGYTIGTILERITLGKLFAKGYKKVYNLLVKLLKTFKDSKLGRIILK